MKTFTINILLAIFLLSGISNVSAKVWRVNNWPGVSADYNNINSAMSAASAGDTIHIEGTPYNYGDVTMTKRLVLLGSGYFISGYGNDTTQENVYPTCINRLWCNNGSQNSILTGITINGNPADNQYTLYFNTNNITLYRCYVVAGAPNSRNGLIRIEANINNITISGCYVYQTWSSTGCCPPWIQTINMGGNNTGIVITNNVIKQGGKTVSSYGSAWAIYMETNCYAVITNNVIMGSMRIFNSTFANNIQIICGQAGCYNTDGSYPNVTQNNIGNTTQFGTLNGNQQNVNMTDVFTYTNNESYDNHYMLKAGSPAIGAGVTGEDCGAYGGSTPYYRSGLPKVPSIYDAYIPATATTSTGIDINIKAKAHR